MKRLSLLIALASGFVAWSARADLDPGVARPPEAKKVPHVTRLHGDERVDNYYWLREKTNPEVIRYLEAENAYTRAVMKPTEPLQETLYKEMLGRIKQTDLSVPYRLGDYWYYTRTEKGKQYPIHCRKKGGLEGAEEVTLDLNELAKGQKFFNLQVAIPSDDGNLLAYITDVTGFRQYTLHVKDLRTGKILPDHAEHVWPPAWAADNKTIFYVREDQSKRPYRLYRHVLGADKDELVYEEKDELYRLMVRRSRDRAYLFATSVSSTTTEERYLKSDQPTAGWSVLLPRKDGHEYHADHREGLFYIRTNRDAKNFRLVTAPVDEPGPDHWKELLARRDNVLLENVFLFADYLVALERASGLPQLHVYDFRDHADRTVVFGDPVYSLMPDLNPEFNTGLFRYHYQTLTTPDAVYDYDLASGQYKLLKQTDVLGGFDPKNYQSERFFVTASDGAKIPVSVAYRKDKRGPGPAPLLLYGYGSYGLSLPVTFSVPRLSLLDRGVVFAMAHIRGGKEMGQAWHEQGKMMHKKNTFTDFVAVAEHLIEKGYTSRDRLAIEGGSAGGLLIGAVCNMRPDLFKAAVLHVPFVDVINTMSDASLPLTVQEYLEWGDPEHKRSEYEYIKTYCPYTNIAAKDYPAMLVVTSLNDSQVMYWEPAKYVAKMRATRTDHHPLLLKINMAAGHGGASGRYDALREQAFTAAFVLTELGRAE